VNMNRHAITLTVPGTPGYCRWCHCSETNACETGALGLTCSWANRDRTLCSACVPLDRSMRNAAGRRELAEFLQEHGFLVGR